MNQANINSKATFARLLAVENVDVIHDPRAKTASFDLKNRQLTFPVWSKMSDGLYNGLVAHEMGHALNTEMERWKKAVEDAPSLAQLYNVLEDVRVDKKMRQRFPGIPAFQRDLWTGAKDVDLFQMAKNYPKGFNGANFLDRLNMHFKSQGMEKIDFKPEEQELVDGVRDMETFDDVLAMAEKIIEFLKQQKQQQQQQGGEGEEGEEGQEGQPQKGPAKKVKISNKPQKNGQKGQKAKDIEVDENTEYEFDDSGDEGEEGEEEGEGKGQGEGEEEGEGEGEGKDEAGESAGGQETKKAMTLQDILDELQSKTMEAMTKALEKMAEQSMQGGRRANVVATIWPIKDNGNLTRKADDLNQLWDNHYPTDRKTGYLEGYSQFYMIARNTAEHMARQFDMKKAADEWRRTSIAKTGKLDPQRLHMYKMNDDIFRRNSVVRAGKNHGLVIYLDLSGSMQDKISAVMRQAIIFAIFAKKVNIPFRILGFSDISHLGYSKSLPGETVLKTGRTNPQLGNVSLREFINSDMAKAKFTKSLENMFAFGEKGSGPTSTDTLHGTPLNAALATTLDIVPTFKAVHRLQKVQVIFITDGGDSHRNNTIEAAARMVDPTGCHMTSLKEWEEIYRELNTKGQDHGYDMGTIGMCHTLALAAKGKGIGFTFIDLKVLGDQIHHFENVLGDDYIKIPTVMLAKTKDPMAGFKFIKKGGADSKDAANAMKQFGNSKKDLKVLSEILINSIVKQ